MKLCRFNANRIGVVDAGKVMDVTDLFDTHPEWPLPAGDWIARQIPHLLTTLRQTKREGVPLPSVRLETPIVSPTKIMGAPVNYKAHQAEAIADKNISHGRDVPQIGTIGLFLKANSALLGPQDKIQLGFSDRRNDHELELVAVIGREGRNISRQDALEHVLGYAIGLDMTVRGVEFPSFRKSVDTYAVLGPWLVTADEIPDPGNLRLSLKVNGEERQNASTKGMIFDVPALIEYASSFYTLYPGDLLYTGSPEGVSQVYPEDVLEASIERIGDMRLDIAATYRR